MEQVDKKDVDIKKQRNTKLLIGAFILLSFIFGWAFGHFDYQSQLQGLVPNVLNKNSAQNVDFGIFWQAWDKISGNFDGKLDYQKMIYGAVDGMVKAVGDPYTVFMTPDQTKAFDQELEGSISGIGAEVGIKDNRVTIVAPIDNSPAQKAGLRAGDTIISINGEDTTGMDLNTAVSKIRGDIGTKVKLVIERNGAQATYEITREKISTQSVKWEIKDNNIGYIQITRFDSNTANLVSQAANELKNKNVRGIVLDLRNNPGGYLDAAVDVGSEFIKNGVIVSEKATQRNGKETKYEASGKGKLTDTNIPVVVLVNGGSASAAEIVAGAIQDNGRGTLIGEKTFGKGSVQTVENLPGGASLRITIAHWFTPKGKNINKEGITPNIESKPSDEDIKNNVDSQLQRALDYINSKS